jgi:hypothetical protein
MSRPDIHAFCPRTTFSSTIPAMLNYVISAAQKSLGTRNTEQFFLLASYHIWLPSYSLKTRAMWTNYLLYPPISMPLVCWPLRYMNRWERFRLLITTDRCSQIQCRLMQWGLSRRSGSWPVCMQERDRLAHLTRNIVYRMPCGRSCKPVGLQIPRQGQRRQCLCSGSVSFSPFHVLMMLCARSAYLGSRY